MSEVDINFQLKHADTKESAQEEILICFGISIKEKLQNEWKEQKSHENLYYLFETIVSYFVDYLNFKLVF